MLELSPLLTDRQWRDQWILCAKAGPLSEAEYHFRRLRERFETVCGPQPFDPRSELPFGMWEAMRETAKLKLSWTPG